MLYRIYYAVVLMGWLVSVGWLITNKILPPLMGGTPPEYTAEPTEAWKITFQDQPVGKVITMQEELPAGGHRTVSMMRFEKLPLNHIMREILGPLYSMLGSAMSEAEMPDQFSLISCMEFDDSNQLDQLFTKLNSSYFQLDVHGTSTSQQQLDLHLKLYQIPEQSKSLFQLKRSLKLPAGTLVGDTLSPKGRMENLQVGQRWTIPVYRGFPPTKEVEIIEARVLKHQEIGWQGNLIETKLVEYLPDAGTGLTSAREPIGRAWVDLQGRIIKQELKLGHLSFMMIRLPDDEARLHTAALKSDMFLQQFSKMRTPPAE